LTSSILAFLAGLLLSYLATTSILRARNTWTFRVLVLALVCLVVSPGLSILAQRLYGFLEIRFGSSAHHMFMTIDIGFSMGLLIGTSFSIVRSIFFSEKDRGQSYSHRG
jgi:hypothetical protein